MLSSDRSVQDTSILSFLQLQEGLGERQAEVLKACTELLRVCDDFTDRELSRFMDLSDPNGVRPRRNELVRKGILRASTKRLCRVSGKVAIAWNKSVDSRGEEEEKEKQFFQVLRRKR